MPRAARAATTERSFAAEAAAPAQQQERRAGGETRKHSCGQAPGNGLPGAPRPFVPKPVTRANRPVACASPAAYDRAALRDDTRPLPAPQRSLDAAARR